MFEQGYRARAPAPPVAAPEATGNLGREGQDQCGQSMDHGRTDGATSFEALRSPSVDRATVGRAGGAVALLEATCWGLPYMSSVQKGLKIPQFGFSFSAGKVGSLAQA